MTDNGIEDITRRAQDGKDSKTFGDFGTPKLLPEQSSGNLSRPFDFLLSQNGKVSNVGQQVKNSHKDDCRVGRILNGPNRVFNFIDHIERIRIASIGEDNVHQSV